MLVYKDVNKSIKITYDKYWQELTVFKNGKIVKTAECDENEVEDVIEILLWEVG